MHLFVSLMVFFCCKYQQNILILLLQIPYPVLTFQIKCDSLTNGCESENVDVLAKCRYDKVSWIMGAALYRVFHDIGTWSWCVCVVVVIWWGVCRSLIMFISNNHYRSTCFEDNNQVLLYVCVFMFFRIIQVSAQGGLMLENFKWITIAYLAKVRVSENNYISIWQARKSYV